jgi:microcystin-dependent protein
MGQPFIGEIRMFGGNFAPAGWAFCDGSPQAINENDPLFELIGTMYGGDGETTFNLPDLRGRLPMHVGQGPGLSVVQMAEIGGSEEVTLTTSQIPSHSHPHIVSGNIATQTNPQNHVFAQSTQATLYTEGQANIATNAATIQSTGGSQPHSNMQPCLVVSFIIALFGVSPTAA